MPRVIGQKTGTDRKGHDVYTPIVIVTIGVGPCIATRPAIIDSGADTTIVPIEFLVDCGVDYDKLPPPPPGSKSKGAGGAFESRELAARVKWREWIVTDVILVAGPKSLPAILLGRADFFGRFNIRFRWDAIPPYVDVDPVATPKAGKGKL
jgi:hypothetical protein